MAVQVTFPVECYLYCRTCEKETLHVAAPSRASSDCDVCGRPVQVVEIWTTYSIDDHVYPPTILLPLRLRVEDA